jgi:signal transduction histidine kinase
LDNLISNAIKYSEHGKEIRVSVAQTGATVRIAVADKGQGLSSEDMELLFKDFQKLSARPTGGEGSTGLGLSVVKHLIELHGGKVWAESAGKGQGSTFYVELPV